MKVRLWGTRGSIPVSSLQTACYGGNTSCVEVQTAAGDCIIIDAGSGIRSLGEELISKHEGKSCVLLLTHAHWDHLQGLPHFAPLFSSGWQVRIMGAWGQDSQGVPLASRSTMQAMRDVFDGYHFPIAWDSLNHPPEVSDFTPGDTLSIGSATVETCPTNHPGGNVAFRVSADGWSIVITGDHECLDDPSAASRVRLTHFMNGADVVLADAQFSKEDQALHKGWGHSHMHQWIDVAVQAKVSHLVFTHFAPQYSDHALELELDHVRHACANQPLLMELAYEGMHISPHGAEKRQVATPAHDTDCQLCDFSRHISRFSDTGTILESILSEARALSTADAGTIYLVEDDKLVFAYSQNDTLFPVLTPHKHIYLNASLPLDQRSIAGFVATTHSPLNIPDVHTLPPNAPYSFNSTFDLASGYRTVSVLAVPFLGNHDKMLGVLQLINCLQDGHLREFTQYMQRELERLAVLASNSIERAQMANELILRMLQTAALRDPSETASHVMRVGAMAGEIYHRWAERRRVPTETMRSMKDRIRLAAMLHDVGKVGIPDAILKKPGRFNPEERSVVEQHCAMGARLFRNATWDVDILAHDIALHHHQKWDGTGYTGDSSIPRLAGEAIPLGARITAVADVYDALVSRRCYKESWSPERALTVIRQDAGTHFDPELVDVFLEIFDTINAIRIRYPDNPDLNLS